MIKECGISLCQVCVNALPYPFTQEGIFLNTIATGPNNTNLGVSYACESNEKLIENVLVNWIIIRNKNVKKCICMLQRI